MENVKFNLLDGSFVMGGTYNAANLAKPAFNFNMKIIDLSIQEAYKAFNTVQILAPAAKFVEGKFSTDMNISSLLGMDMMPLMETFTGLGAMLVLEGKVSDMPITKKMGEASKLTGSGSREIQLKNTKITYRVENGRIYFDPFDVNAGNTLLNISGSNGFDQSIQYLIKLDAPSGAVGQAANAAVSSLTGGKKVIGERLKAEIRMGGTFQNPKILGVKGDGEGSAQNQAQQALEDKAGELKDKATEEAERLKKEAEDKARKEAERLKKEAEDKARMEADRLKNAASAKAGQEADRLKKEAEEKARKEADRLKNEAEERARKEAERKAQEEAQKKLKEESDKLKNKLKFPK
jgi:hypothetical protein